jgi:hypothetical protein
MTKISRIIDNSFSKVQVVLYLPNATIANITTEVANIEQLATKSSTRSGDLIVTIDYDFSKNKKKDDNEDKAVDASYGIKG